MKNGKNKCTFMFICIAVVVVGLFVGYFMIKNLEYGGLLKEEIIKLTNKDLLLDDYEIKIKTDGDFAYIEEKIKDYYKNLSDNIKIINGYLSDENLIQILSVTNLETDRPDFLNSYKIIGTTRENYEKALINIINLCSEDAIRELVDRDKVSKYAYGLYLELVYNQETLNYLNSILDEMKIICDDLGTFLDKVDAVIKLLEDNNDYWYIDDGQLYFKTNGLVNQYNELYSDLKKFVTDKFSKYDGAGSINQTNNNI